MTSVNTKLKLAVEQAVRLFSTFSGAALCCEPYQFAHAALLHSHSVLTFVVKTHLAGFAAEAVLCCVSRQEHHMLGCRT